MKYAYGQREACAYCGHDIEFHGKEGWRDRGGGRSCLTYYHRLSGEFVTPGTKHSPTKRGAALKKGTTHMDYDLYEPQHRPVLDALLLVQSHFPKVSRVLADPRGEEPPILAYADADGNVFFRGHSGAPFKDAASVGTLKLAGAHVARSVGPLGGVFYMVPPKVVPPDKPPVELRPSESLQKAPAPSGALIVNPLLAAAKAFAKDFFEARAKAFASDPGGDNWRLLRYAMWTLQAAGNMWPHHVKALVASWPAEGDASEERCAEALVQAVNGQSLEELRKDEAKYDLDGSE